MCTPRIRFCEWEEIRKLTIKFVEVSINHKLRQRRKLKICQKIISE
jgi:hypothetical protein